MIQLSWDGVDGEMALLVIQQVFIRKYTMIYLHKKNAVFLNYDLRLTKFRRIAKSRSSKSGLCKQLIQYVRVI